MSSGNTVTPLQKPTSVVTQFQSLQFFVLQRLLKMQTVTLVQVQAVNGGGLGPVGTVDVLPLVDQVDGAGNSVAHVTLYERPYVRWQGGTNAVILDPAVGDIGVMIFGSRDLSSVLASGKHGPPPTSRNFNYADGLYIGAIPRATPQNYILFDNSGDVTVKSLSGNITMLTPGGNVNINGAQITSAGEVKDALGKVLGTHDHSPGSFSNSAGAVTGTSGAPV